MSVLAFVVAYAIGTSAAFLLGLLTRRSSVAARTAARPLPPVDPVAQGAIFRGFRL